MKLRKTWIVCLIAVSSSVSALRANNPSVSVLLEKGIYTEETVGDLPKAIGIYEQIIESEKANEQYVVEALFRLGRCLVTQNKKAEARKVLNKLVTSYPNQAAFVAKANALLSDLNTLKLNPAPWQDGETLSYRMAGTSGMEIGEMKWSAESTEKDGKACWAIQQDTAIKINNAAVFSRTLAEKESFAPVSAWSKNQLGEMRAEYAPGKVTIRNMDDESATPRELEYEGTVYDNDQVLYLIRRLPLKKNYAATLRIVSIMSGAGAMECRIRVMESDEVSVPAGTFDCWKIRLQAYAGSSKVIEQWFWYSKKDQVLVKMDTGPVTIELISQTAKGEND